ncbi:MAG: hypothetical protein J7647_13605 [Cyanobacteria bacterium SBLK]|nr:hypothetical protein [Cyanobacteria bacterium SBLK]
MVRYNQHNIGLTRQKLRVMELSKNAIAPASVTNRKPAIASPITIELIQNQYSFFKNLTIDNYSLKSLDSHEENQPPNRPAFEITRLYTALARTTLEEEAIGCRPPKFHLILNLSRDWRRFGERSFF